MTLGAPPVKALVIFSVLLLFLTPTYPASADTDFQTACGPYVRSFDYAKIDNVLVTLKTAKNFPPIRPTYTPPFRPTVAQPIPKVVQTLAESIQTTVFGKVIFELIVEDVSGGARMDTLGMKIGILPSAMNAYLAQGPSGEGAVLFVLAHEISHYIYEYYLSFLSPDHKSLAGQETYMVNWDLSASYNPTEPREKIISAMVRQMGSEASVHSEVDAYAIRILERMGQTSAMMQESTRIAFGLNSQSRITLWDNRSVGLGSPIITFEPQDSAIVFGVTDLFVRLLSANSHFN
jgi:hypothetical protein